MDREKRREYGQIKTNKTNWWFSKQYWGFTKLVFLCLMVVVMSLSRYNLPSTHSLSAQITARFPSWWRVFLLGIVFFISPLDIGSSSQVWFSSNAFNKFFVFVIPMMHHFVYYDMIQGTQCKEMCHTCRVLEYLVWWLFFISYFGLECFDRVWALCWIYEQLHLLKQSLLKQSSM